MKEFIATKNPYVKLSWADKDDVPLILSLIKSLAEYEKLSNEVIATEELLRKKLFEERKVAEVIIAHFKNEPVGFALFFHNFSTFIGKPGIYLEDLFVRPEYRGKGIGKILLSFLGKIALDRDCGRIEWAVLDWNEPSIEFYKKLGATAMDEWTTFRVTGQTIYDLARLFD